MSPSQSPGPIGITPPATTVQDGTLALQPSPQTGPAGVPTTSQPASAPPAPQAVEKTDTAIEALDLAVTAREAAYALKKKHPAVTFTSGRRTKQDQARAMAGNVVKNRKWIEETYEKTKVRDACQKWVDDNSDKKTKAEIEAGLSEVLNKFEDDKLGVLSRHLSGMAFDVQPVTDGAEEIKKTIKGLKGLHRFLEKEGGLIRWHAQFE